MGRSVWSFLFASVLLVGSAAMTTATTPDVTSDIDVSRGSATAASPALVLSGDFSQGIALALDQDGHRHLVAGNLRGDLWYATDRTGTWTTKRLLSGREGWFGWSYPSIAMDENDRVHVAAVKWEWSTPSGTGGIWYLTDAGRTRADFGTATRIAGSMMTSPSLRVVDGIRYLAYAKCDCLPMQSRAPLYFKTDRSGSVVTERLANVAYDPSLRVDRDGRAHIVYSDRQGLRYTRATTRTGDFTTPARIPGTSGLEGTPSLALDTSDQAHIAWSTWKQGHPLFYVERTSAGWSTPLRLGNGTSTELSIDASDRPHVVLGWDKVIHRWLAGGTWQSTVVVSDVSSVDAAIRAFGTGATIAWSQDVSPSGVWVVRD
ncbi:MAG TPA: hypothetical protein VJZ50_10845 [Candidatus Limnocylindrales bacterium]|nr:hypothetical protein [Candidatus Limnocylindrales bacterium]